jgi:hypothetical protein
MEGGITPLPSPRPRRRWYRRRRACHFLGEERQGQGAEYRFGVLFARERFHEVGGVDLIPVSFTGFGWVWTGCETRPGLTEQAFEAGRE